MVQLFFHFAGTPDVFMSQCDSLKKTDICLANVNNWLKDSIADKKCT